MQWYEDEVRALERSLGARTSPAQPPVFYGSSSIRGWDTLAEDVGPGVVNAGFGGSTLEACDYFFPRIVPPLKPRSLLVYAGDNDLGDGRSVEQTFGSFGSLADKVQAFAGTIPFGFISVKPSPARAGVLDRIRRFNDLARAKIESLPGGYFVDVFNSMVAPSGDPNPAFFLSDGLHLNREGYRLWGRLLEPYRNKIFIE